MSTHQRPAMHTAEAHMRSALLPNCSNLIRSMHFAQISNTGSSMVFLSSGRCLGFLGKGDIGAWGRWRRACLCTIWANTRSHQHVRHDEELGAAPPTHGGQTGQGDRSDRLAGRTSKDPTNARPGGTPSGQAYAGVF